MAQLGEHATNLDAAVAGTAILSPADLERENRNLVHGDPYSGACALEQLLLWRPVPTRPGHQTPVDRLVTPRRCMGSHQKANRMLSWDITWRRG
jgi:phytoene dehydrogenase-like protein